MASKARNVGLVGLVVVFAVLVVVGAFYQLNEQPIFIEPTATRAVLAVHLPTATTSLTTELAIEAVPTETPYPVSDGPITCTPPCVFTDRWGGPGLRTARSDTPQIGGFLLNLRAEGNQIAIAGYDFSDLTEVQPAQWRSVTVWINGEHVVGCSGSYDLVSTDIQRLMSVKLDDVTALKAQGDSMGVCHLIQATHGG